jgi:dTMP kinase
VTPYWVSVEGVNGVGKTYLIDRVARKLGPRCRPVREVTDSAADRLPGRVIAALAGAGDTFLRTGHPLTETFALLALKVREYEEVMAAAQQTAPVVVLEDRGVDTVAVYQSAILRPEGTLEETHSLARRVYALGARWRPPPDRTILLVDDFGACLARFEQRLGKRLTGEDTALLHRITQLYARQAAAEPDRFQMVDRTGRTEADVVAAIGQACTTLLAERPGPCHG